MFVAPLILAAVTSGMSDVLLQRVADGNFPHVLKHTVTVGALPPNWTPTAPLPQLPVVGSVASGSYETEVYYQPADSASALQTYLGQLGAAGYEKRIPPQPHGGFKLTSSTPSDFTVMCRGDEGVTIYVPARDDLRVTVPSAKRYGPCMPQPMRVTAPLPDLAVPENTTVSGGDMNETSFSVEGGESLMRSATIGSALPLKSLLASFAKQMHSAHWVAGRAHVLPDAASQAFAYNDGKLQWKATLMLLPGTKAHTYHAMLSASGTPDNAPPRFSPMPLGRAGSHVRASDEPYAAQLAQRIALMTQAGPVRPEIFIRKLPAAFNAQIPLPSGTLVGSLDNGVAQQIYFNVTQPQYSAYAAKLAQSGWSTLPQQTLRFGGFAQPDFVTRTEYCKTGLPAVTTFLRQNTNELRIAIGPYNAPSCAGRVPLSGVRQSPIPNLLAPAGATMRLGTPGISGGTSGASIVSTKPLRALLADFAAQFTAAKWVAATPLTSDALGSQTFTYTADDGSRWQAALTLYRSGTDPKTYYAYVDVTKL